METGRSIRNESIANAKGGGLSRLINLFLLKDGYENEGLL
jgi:hypothetical protein